MAKTDVPIRDYLFILLIINASTMQNLTSQPVIGQDNWVNREINATTGDPFHYLWTDTDLSGYSTWGDMFDHDLLQGTYQNRKAAEN
jgi:hypothetical protein